MYQIRLTKTAQKQLKKLDTRYQSAINKAFTKLTIDPQLGKPLVGELKGYWRVRFSRYRIIYKIENKKLIVFIFDIKHRKDVYR